MITHLYNNVRLLTQQHKDQYGSPFEEPPIAASTDSCGIIVLQQGADTILVNHESVTELCQILRDLKDCGNKGGRQ